MAINTFPKRCYESSGERRTYRERLTALEGQVSELKETEGRHTRYEMRDRQVDDKQQQAQI